MILILHLDLHRRLFIIFHRKKHLIIHHFISSFFYSTNPKKKSQASFGWLVFGITFFFGKKKKIDWLVDRGVKEKPK